MTPHNKRILASRKRLSYAKKRVKQEVKLIRNAQQRLNRWQKVRDQLEYDISNKNQLRFEDMFGGS